MSELRTVAFIDLAGFTTATATHGDEVAADLAGRLCELTSASLGAGDQLVKGLGDAVMLISRQPSDALALVGRICRLADYEVAFPLLRVGIHHGPVVERNADWFGATINIGARVAALAAADQVLATADVAEAARRAGLAVVPVGATTLRGTAEAVDLFEVRPCEGAPGRVIDPVCRMAVIASRAPARCELDGVEHVFCSVECAAVFGRQIDDH